VRCPVYLKGFMFIAQAAQEAGLLSNAGALIDPIDGGLLVFENASVDQIKEFLSNDPCKCIEDCTHACATQIYATPRCHLPTTSVKDAEHWCFSVS
jgi:hypothetical protein